MAVPTITYYIPQTPAEQYAFDVFSLVNSILAGIGEQLFGYEPFNIVLTVGAHELLRIEVIDPQLDESGKLVGGTVLSFLLEVDGRAMVKATGFALDVEDARLANPGTYPLPSAGFVYHAEEPYWAYGPHQVARFHAGSGNDLVFGGGGGDELDGRDGNDLIYGYGGNDLLFGGRGNDTIKAGDHHDYLDGGDGVDSLFGSVGNDWLLGGKGQDILDGGPGSDVADYSDKTRGIEVHLNGAHSIGVKVGGALEDKIVNIEGVVGGTRADKLVGDKQNNFFGGDGGRDFIDGGAGSDAASYADKTKGVEIALNSGRDVIAKVGGVAEDTLRSIENVYGGDGNDKLSGDAQDNMLVGAAGADTLSGGAGHDDLFGGTGKDLLSGGSGNDYFYFNAAPKAADADRVTDFDRRYDKIILSLDWVNPHLADGVASSHFRHGTSAQDANDFLIYDKANGKLYYDADGSAVQKQILLATFTNEPDIRYSDIWIV